MRSHKSLVAFTLLVQCAIGSVWCIGAAFLLADAPFHYGLHTIVALLLVFLGMLSSVGHLGRPGVCFYAVRNLRSSWLSREIAVTVTFGAAVAAMGLTVIRPGASSGWVVFVASAIGGLVLYAMARSYRLRTVPSWNRNSVLLAFVSSALLLGGLQCALVSGIAVIIPEGTPDLMGLRLSLHVGLLATFIGFVMKAGIRRANSGQVAKRASLVRSSPSFLHGVGVAWWVIALIFRDSALPQSILLWAGGFFLVVAEIRQRMCFYGSYRNSGF
jgi:DMSO reductase anchor subunit